MQCYRPPRTSIYLFIYFLLLLAVALLFSRSCRNLLLLNPSLRCLSLAAAGTSSVSQSSHTTVYKPSFKYCLNILLLAGDRDGRLSTSNINSSQPARPVITPTATSAMPVSSLGQRAPERIKNARVRLLFTSTVSVARQQTPARFGSREN